MLKKLMLTVIVISMCLGCGCAESSESGSNADLNPNNKEPQITERRETEEERAARLEKLGMNSFITVDGKKLTDGENEYTIRAMALGNLVWNNPSLPEENHHDEASYNELYELGFNSVRFYLNYGLFEDDDNPYVYKDTGFEWLDKNIEWAKNNGIRLIFNMHVPQGGYQSMGEGTALWEDPEIQNRLIALWKAIAEHCKDDPSVLGYDLLNEPVVEYKGSVEEAFLQWKSLAERIISAIREVDPKHIVFVERINYLKNYNVYGDWAIDINGDMNYTLLDYDNIVYEFHTYTPLYYTHQAYGNNRAYPNENKVFYSNARWAGSSQNNSVYDPSLGDEWQYLEGEMFKADSESFKIGEAVAKAANIGVGGKIYFDDIVIGEYDENGEYIRDVLSCGFDEEEYWGLWSPDNSASHEYSKDIGHNQAGCLCICNASEETSLSNFDEMFVPVQGYYYKISGWVKAESTDGKPTAFFTIDFMDADDVSVFNKEALENEFVRNIKFGEENNVPLFLGEFGANTACFRNNCGGDIYVEDMIDLCLKYGINFCYHDYHGNGFGLYRNAPDEKYDVPNKALMEVFKDKLKR